MSQLTFVRFQHNFAQEQVYEVHGPEMKLGGFIKPSLLQDRTSYIYLFQRRSIVFKMKLHAEILTVP